MRLQKLFRSAALALALAVPVLNSNEAQADLITDNAAIEASFVGNDETDYFLNASLSDINNLTGFFIIDPDLGTVSQSSNFNTNTYTLSGTSGSFGFKQDDSIINETDFDTLLFISSGTTLTIEVPEIGVIGNSFSSPIYETEIFRTFDTRFFNGASDLTSFSYEEIIDSVVDFDNSYSSGLFVSTTQGTGTRIAADIITGVSLQAPPPAVPEPSSLPLVCLFGLAVMVNRPRRNPIIGDAPPAPTAL